MNLRLLGTGAADGIPGFFSDDPVSRYARAHGGKDVRSRSAALVDDTIKLDLPPDSFMQCVRYGVDPTEWTAVFFTHSDDDHFSVAELQYAMTPFSRSDCSKFTVYANATVFQCITERYPDWPLDVVKSQSFCPIRHGDYLITPILANHISGEDCHNLVIENDGKRILYGTDTGYWSEETFAFLETICLDAMVLECTDGINKTSYSGHLNIESCIAVVARLREAGTLSPDSRVITTHHSCRGGLRHCELEAHLLPERIEVGYDGMSIEV